MHRAHNIIEILLKHVHFYYLIPISSSCLADNITKANLRVAIASLSCDIVDCMQLLTRDSLLKDFSPPATDTAWNSY